MDLAKLDVCPSFSFQSDNTTCHIQNSQAAIGQSHSLFTVNQIHGPNIFLLAVVPLYLFYVFFHRKQYAHPRSGSQINKFTTVFLNTLSIIQLTRHGGKWDILSDGKVRSYVDWTQICSCIVIAMMVKENNRRWITSIPRFLFWLLMLLSTCLNVYNIFVQKAHTTNMVSFLLDITYLLGIVVHLVLPVFKGGIKEQQTSHTGEPIHPEESASFISNLFLCWLTGLLRKGYSQKLQEEDIPGLCKQDRCETVYPPFGLAWMQEKQKCDHINRLEEKTRATWEQSSVEGTESCSNRKTKKEREPSLIRAMFKAYGFKYFVVQISKCLLELSLFINPLLLEDLIKHIENRNTEPAWKGYAIVITMFLVTTAKDTIHERFEAARHRLFLHMKMALRMTVFRKAMTATNESKRDKTVGELVSLISEDVDKLINCNYMVNFIVITPIQVSIALYMLYCQLGIGAFVGLAIMLSLIPFNSWVGKKIHALEEEKSKVKDERVKAMNEILNGIKVLKLYAWERSFIRKVSEIRKREVALNKWLTFCNACIDLMFQSIPILVRLAGFLVFIILGGYLDPTKAFVTASLFSILNSPFSIMALIIPQFVQASISIKRINDFLRKSDIRDDIVVTDSQADSAVHIQNGTFTWYTSAERSTLTNLNLKIKKGELVAVVGMVGSGKSSLLSAILGEMEKLKGQVTVQSKLAYVSQEAWIQNETLRDNILFGSELESMRYDQVVSACALKEDLQILAAGDKTEIGEKGINLSGGQKQRVSLARAVYSNADIFLLDDPLSAVDAHVGKHIFNKVIGHSGLLQNKTRILVTHGVHWLPFVDNIIVMKEGQISECGTYKQLLSHNGDFAQFLKEVFAHDKEDNDNEMRQIKKNIYTRLSSLTEMEPQEAGDVLDPELNCSIEEKNHISSSNSDSDDDDYETDDETNNRHGNRDYDNDNAGKIVNDEDTEKGSVSFEVYKEYARAVGPRSIILFSLIFLTALLSRDFKTLWLGKWTEDPLLANTSLMNTTEYQSTSWMYITVYSLCGGLEVLTAFIFIIILESRTYEAANKLHNQLLTNVLRLPMSFFDTTPTGRIISRFSKDVASVDELGGCCLDGYIRCLGNIFINLFLVMFLTPRIIFIIFLVSLLYIYLQQLYMASARQLRRWSSKHSSPIYACIKETLSGATTVRAFGAQDQFFTKLESKIETHTKFNLMARYVSRWSSIRIILLSQFIELAAGFIILWDTTIPLSMAGPLLMYSSGFVQYLDWFVFHSTYTEQELVSLERVIEYASKPTEASWEIPESAPLAEWPQNGEIAMDEFKIRYREGLDLVLKGVTFNIRSGEKIGIVGRTGAGKSSLTVALFRLVEAASGKIVIDDHQISTMGLHDLRTKITILPQDPVIFGGSLRMNLDPFNEKSTDELWEALRHSHLQRFVESLPDKLDYDCGEGGRNLSGGQRQLVCLARTLLRKSKILVLDEATAAVDMETDDLIQKTICNEFKDCTVLTIAHRLNTIMDYDRVLVMDQGLVKEFDSPKVLLADPSSMFYSLAKDAGQLS